MKSQARKHVTTVLILSVFASCFFMVKIGNAATTPEFTLKATDPNKIEITITNREYASTVNGIEVKPYFQIREKLHDSETWPEVGLPDSPDLTQTADSKYTVTQIATYYYTNNTQVDVQIRTILAGYVTHHPQSGSGFIPDYSEFQTMLTLPWTDPQTVTVYSVSQATPIPTQTTSQTQNPTPNWEQTAIIVLAVLVAASWAAIVMLWRKKTTQLKNAGFCASVHCIQSSPKQPI